MCVCVLQYQELADQVRAAPTLLQHQEMSRLGYCRVSRWNTGLTLLETENHSHVWGDDRWLSPLDDEIEGALHEYGAWALIWTSIFILPHLRFVQTIMEEKEYKVRVSSTDVCAHDRTICVLLPGIYPGVWRF